MTQQTKDKVEDSVRARLNRRSYHVVNLFLAGFILMLPHHEPSDKYVAFIFDAGKVAAIGLFLFSSVYLIYIYKEEDDLAEQ
jgi:hypothetical protein